MRLNGNLSVVGQIKDLKVERLATDPVSPALSQMWFNTAEVALKYYDGVEIQTIAKGGNLDEYLRLDGTSAMTGELTLSSADQSLSADTVAVSKGHLDTQLATKQDVITGAASTVTSSNLSVSMAVVSDASGKIVSTTSATAAEVEHLAGVTSNIQQQIDSKQDDLGYVPVNKAGDSMSGDLVMSNNRITSLGAPVNSTDAARKIDIENAVAGLDFQADVLAAQADATLDPGATPTTGDRYIITNAASLHANFGTITGVENNDIVEYDGSAFVVVYDVSVSGPGALAWNRGTSTFVRYDGTDWSEFGGLSGVVAGAGLEKNGNEIYVNFGAGIGQLPTDEVGVHVSTDGGLFTTEDGSTESTASGASLAIKLNGTSLRTGVAGLDVSPAGINEAHIASTALGNGLQGGSGTTISVATAEASGITVDASGVSVDRAELRNTFLARDGAEAMTGVLHLSSTDQSAELDTAAVSKGHLDAALSTQTTAVSDLTTRMEAGYFVYTSAAPSTSHTITHNMGNMYVQVSVVDSLDEVVLPESITFTDANSLTVTFTNSEDCKVIVTGLKAAA